MKGKTIYTIGHSTHTMESFLSMLQSFSINTLVDVRHYPGSKRYPHFNKDVLAQTLEARGINYVHLVNLGGRRKALPGSKNTAWRNDAFRGYADFMETDTFQTAAEELQRIAIKTNVAFMCSEAVWWRCHRSLIADYLKIRGWKVLHIMGMNKAEEHPFTSPARVENGQLRYNSPSLF